MRVTFAWQFRDVGDVVVSCLDFVRNKMAMVGAELGNHFRVGGDDLEIHTGAIGMIANGLEQGMPRQRVRPIKGCGDADFQWVTLS